MSDDWRAKIDAQLEEERRRKLQSNESSLTRSEMKKAEKIHREMEAFKAEEARKLAYHQSIFRCHILGCTNVSSGPAVTIRWISGDGRSAPAGEWTYQTEDRHWDIPTNLDKCERCGKWTCQIHLHQGICKDHA